MPGMNLYLTMEQYLSQSFPYFLEHLVDGIKNGTEKGQRLNPYLSKSRPHRWMRTVIKKTL